MGHDLHDAKAGNKNQGVLMPEVRRVENPTVPQKIDRIVDSVEELVERFANVERLLAAESASEERLYSRSEAAQILGVSTRTIDRRIKSGQLRTVKLGTSLRITGASILRIRRDSRPPAVEVLPL